MFIKILKEILKDKSFTRALLNIELAKYVLKGKVLDVGGGKGQEYIDFMKKETGCEIFNTDYKSGDSGHRINLEKDIFPFGDNEFDIELNLNVLEHVYNYKFLVDQMHRTLKINGLIYGFVPFFVNVHPDPHDFFRYTGEALQKIFQEAGFKSVKVFEIGRGPFGVAYNNIMVSLPVFLRAVLLPVYYFFDCLYLFFRPDITKRFPLGYFFELRK